MSLIQLLKKGWLGLFEMVPEIRRKHKPRIEDKDNMRLATGDLGE